MLFRYRYGYIQVCIISQPQGLKPYSKLSLTIFHFKYSVVTSHLHLNSQNK